MHKTYLSFLLAVTILLISASQVLAGTPVGTFCWSMTDVTGKPVGAIEMAVNDDAPPSSKHLSAVGIWQRLEDKACTPVHGTIQRDRQEPQIYEIALSYEDILHSPKIQGHFHAKLDTATMFATYAYQDENAAVVIMGQMNKAKCPIQCP